MDAEDREQDLLLWKSDQEQWLRSHGFTWVGFLDAWCFGRTTKARVDTKGQCVWVELTGKTLFKSTAKEALEDLVSFCQADFIEVEQLAAELEVLSDQGTSMRKCQHCHKLHPGEEIVCQTCQEEANQEGLCLQCCGSGLDLGYTHERDSRNCSVCDGTGIDPR